jgi:hypothetical protein
MAVKHKKVLGTAPTSDPNDVDSVDWNADHLGPFFQVFGFNTGNTWRQIFGTAAESDFIIGLYTIADLTYATRCYVTANLRTTPTTAPTMAVKVWTGSAWVFLNAAASGPNVSLTPLGLRVGAEVDVDVAHRGPNKQLKWVWSGGNPSSVNNIARLALWCR